MTDAQIRYRQMEEAKRHNAEQERNWNLTLDEQRRHNAAQERLSELDTMTRAETSRYSADQSAAASKYSADTSASSKRYETDVGHEDRQARLEFDQATQDFKNSITQAQLQLSKLETESNVRNRDAQIKRLLNQTRMDLVRLSNEASRLELDQEAAKWANALKRAQTLESGTRSLSNVIRGFKDIKGIIFGGSTSSRSLLKQPFKGGN